MNTPLVLAYSGGLDTSVAVAWLSERGYDVHAVTIDLGQGDDLEVIRQKALNVGAKSAFAVDAAQEFVDDYISKALLAGGLYEDVYPLATALARPLIAKHLVAAAKNLGATVIAHGCTGKGNDQVRIELSCKALYPEVTFEAPAREWHWNRPEEIAYAKAHGIPVPVTIEAPYSVDANLWGRSIEGGALEDPWSAPPESIYAWTPGGSAHDVTLTFAKGLPVALDGVPMPLLALIQTVHQLAGSAGVGRIDHLEDRLVGIKSREIYEAPAAVLLHTAKRKLESLCLPKDLLLHKKGLAATWAESVYNGQWFAPLTTSLDAYFKAANDAVSGDVRLHLEDGKITVTGVRSDRALYEHALATYDADSQFDEKAAEGFITIFGLSTVTYHRKNGAEVKLT